MAVDQATTCRSCGAENEPGNRFCTQCGTRMEAEAKTEGRGPATQRLKAPPDWERVAVTHLRQEEHRSHPFEEKFTIGRDRGDLTIPDDPFLSTRHAMIRKEDDQFILQDLGSRNGTFVRLREESELLPGDEMMIGRQVFRFRIERSGGPAETPEEEGGGFRTQRLGAPRYSGPLLERVVEGRRVDEVYPLTKERVVIGRDEGDIVFPDDPLMSGTHASVTKRASGDGQTVVLADEGSRNGVFLRIREYWPLQVGDIFTAGQQVFRFEGDPSTAAGSARQG